MKRLVLLLSLFLATPSQASNVLIESMAVTTTASSSGQLVLNDSILIQCDVDVYIRQNATATDTAATATNGLKLTAGNVLSTDTKALGYVSIKAVSGSGNCQILRVVR
jgi:hypothetical protein